MWAYEKLGTYLVDREKIQDLQIINLFVLENGKITCRPSRKEN